MNAGWQTKEFGRVAHWVKGRRPAKLLNTTEAKAVPYVTADYLRTGIPSQFVSQADQQSCPASDPKFPIIIWDGSNAGEVFLGREGILASTMARIEPDTTLLNPLFCYFFLASQFNELNSRTTGATIPHVDKSTLSSLLTPLPPKPEQEKIAAVLWKIHQAIRIEEELIATARELKRAAMHQLFGKGIRNEPQKDSEIGPIPQSWNLKRIDECCDVVSSSLSYTDFAGMSEANDGDTVPAMGIKVSDMNLSGNESQIVRANLQKNISTKFAENRLVPPDTIVFPKRGAAIATNKKRLTTAWTVLDPNLIGVRAGKGVDSGFLFFWFQRFDLRTITEPGPTPQLNKKNLTPLLLPLPNDFQEQSEIASIVRRIDDKISIHKRRQGTLQELFKTMRHQLMVGQIRVANLDIDLTEIK
jgi:type I restriction enzyme S subunit